MSATCVPKRDGTTRARNQDDAYLTPLWAARAILDVLPAINPDDTWLDPCAGEGALLRALAPMRGLRFGFEIDAARTAKAAAFGEVLQRDALSPEPWRPAGRRASCIIANPPFSFAMEFLERALAEVEAGGEVAFLLRLCFLASMKRAAFHRSHPCDIYILPKRPSFTPDGRTDSADYAWFVYGPGHAGAWSILAPLHHREEAELEPRVLDLLARVLVAILQPGKPHDPHDDHRVARVEEHLGRLLGDGHVDAVPLTHGGDRRLV